MPSIRDDHLELAQIASALAALKFEVQLLRYGLARKAGFNFAEPRIPAGNTGGGRWTDGGGSGGLVSAPRTVPRVSHSDAQESATRSIYRADGTLAEQGLANADGSRIVSRYAAPGDSPEWDSTHHVELADGAVATFRNRDNTQEIYDGEGRLLSQTIWAEAGPQPQAIVQPAFLPLVATPAAIATIELALTLYGAYATGAFGPLGAGAQPVIAFTAREYAPGQSPQMTPSYVGALTKEDVEKACRRLGELQDYADDAVRSLDRSDYASAATYGTAVHSEINRRIRALGDPNFVSEFSLLKTRDEVGPRFLSELLEDPGYGKEGSIRIDVLENTGTGTVCVYDFKTGRSGLTAARSIEIASAVSRHFQGVRNILVTQVRPNQ
ncbi:hypothetical protein [Roseixanthobacter glucoisosaccharinicivorans]|uniref:hypothetical protein n=1 Tax=Roseixanthobacter glucoisosaccharinicivorans TaxID=3119923 RepID=UPI00372B46A1